MPKRVTNCYTRNYLTAIASWRWKDREFLKVLSIIGVMSQSEYFRKLDSNFHFDSLFAFRSLSPESMFVFAKLLPFSTKSLNPFDTKHRLQPGFSSNFAQRTWIQRDYPSFFQYFSFLHSYDKHLSPKKSS